ncbi:hypothetical protein C8R43DRAFT_978973, partial [Mycena crocata]
MTYDLIQIPELLIQILEHLALKDLIYASHVNRHWRAVVPQIDSPTRLRLLNLAFAVADGFPTVSHSARLHYVDTVEKSHQIIIPEPYRTILTEWPASAPPPGMHWPHAVLFRSEGYCTCPRFFTIDPCVCALTEVATVCVLIPPTLFSEIFTGAQVDTNSAIDDRHELFRTRPRLHTPEQNARTIEFLRAHPPDEFAWKTAESLALDGARLLHRRVLRLSRYRYSDPDGTQADGTFVMILDGPTRGQIHAWQVRGDSFYDGTEAVDFWEWRYTPSQYGP